MKTTKKSNCRIIEIFYKKQHTADYDDYIQLEKTKKGYAIYKFGGQKDEISNKRNLIIFRKTKKSIFKHFKMYKNGYYFNGSKFINGNDNEKNN